MDWLLFASAVAFALSIHVETRLKIADILMGMDAHLAPDWAFGGWAKSALKTISIFGGLLAAGLLAYDWLHLVGPLWAVAIFAATLCAKYFVSARRSVRQIEEAISKAISRGWKSPEEKAMSDVHGK